MSKSKIFYFCLCLVFLVLIIWRYQVIELRIENNELRKYNDSGEEITFIGIVAREPDIRERGIKLTVKITQWGSVQKTHDREFFAQGRILVTVARYPEYKYGDELKITGKLQTPPVFEDFNYKDYLERDGIYSVMYWPEIELIGENQGNFFYPHYQNFGVGVYAKILDFKNKLRESIYSSLPPNQAYVLGAMILGDKNRMSDDLKEKLNIAGLRHLTAVSGLHIVLISSVLMSLFLGLGFWKGQAFYISIVFIFLFISLTGFQVSSIRAGIMGGLFLLGQKIGRKSVSTRSIVIAAGVILVVNPLLVWDVGFQLSFLACLGIIYLFSFFKKWVKLDILAMTLSAYLFTLPILIYNFGRVSLVAPITNILVLPFVQWIMVSGFIFGLVGIIWHAFGWLLSLPGWFLLTYLIKVVDFFSQAWAQKTIEGVHWFWLIISYLILAISARYLKKEKD